MTSARVRQQVLVLLAVTATVTLSARVVAAAPTTGTPESGTSAAYSFAPSALDGGGFQNVIAYSPFRDATGARPLLIGADTAGIHRSVDGGRTWIPANGGLGDRHVAALLFSSTTPGTAYAATDSALYVSADFGAHWTARAGEVDFHATDTVGTDGQVDPRTTGHLLAQVTSGPTTYLYAATATQGLKRSSDDGATWEQVALAGEHLRSVAVDPSDPDRLFVTAAGQGLQVSTDASTDLTFTPVPGGPTDPGELAFVGPRLYVAAGADGVYRYGSRWHALNAELPPGSTCGAITGYVDGGTGQDVLYVGCADPATGRHTLTSADGGVHWTPLHADGGTPLNAQEYGHAVDWWAATVPDAAFYGSGFATSDVAVDPDDPDKVVVTGRDGAYVALQQPSGVTWWPAVHGLLATDTAQVLADPLVPGRLYAAAGGATFLVSEDAGHSFRTAAPTDAPADGDVLALDAENRRPGDPAKVYLATSGTGTDPGTAHLFSNADPLADPSGWTDEELPVADGVTALGVGHDDAGARVLLASVAGQGLYRKNAGVWTLLSGEAPFGTGGRGAFAWVPGRAVVYAIDGDGVWRSRAAGAAGTWTKLTDATPASGDPAGLVLDPQDPTVLYASDADLGGIVRITGANTRAPDTTVLLPTATPGPLAVRGDGALLAEDRSGGHLLQVLDPSGAATASDVGDSFFAENEGDSTSLSAGPDGSLYTASPDGGVAVAAPPGTPAAEDTTVPAPPTGLSVGARSANSVALGWDPSDDPTVTGYQVLRDGIVIASTEAPSWTNTGASPSTRYRYQVQAVDGGGNVSDPSASRVVTTPAGPPPEPTPSPTPTPTPSPTPTPRPTPTPTPSPTPSPTPPPVPSGPISWGSSVMAYGSETFAQALARVQQQLHPQLLRRYINGAPSWPTATGGLPLVISFKILPKEVLSGSHDAQLAAFFAATPRRAYWSYWHEPENDIEHGRFTAADYRAAWVHIAAIARASGKPLVPTLILMGYTTKGSSGRTWTDYYPGRDVVDVLAWDCYARVAGETPENVFGSARAASVAAGKPWAVAETGVGSHVLPDPATRRAALTAMSKYLADSTPKPVFVSYFDSEPDAISRGFGWNITQDPAAAAAWLAGMSG